MTAAVLGPTHEGAINNRAGGLPAAPSGTRGFRLLALACLLFTVKFALYGWFVTPFWEIPDEPGHFSYIEELREGSYPELGRSRMTEEVSHSWRGEGKAPGLNWIAQHPPVYYLLALPVDVVAAAAGADFGTRVKAVRVVTALIAGLALLGLGMFTRLATGNDTLAIAAAAFFAATPMFTHLGGGVTHDPLVAATVAWCAYWYVRWLRSDRLRDILLCALFAALCMGTKITAIAMAVPLFGMIALRATFAPGARLLSGIRLSAVVWVVMFLPICLWMARNMVIFDNPLPDARLLKTMNPKEIGFFEYMLRHPIWQSVVLNFIALVGWTGQAKGTVNFVQATGLTAQFFTGALLLFSWISLARLAPWFDSARRASALFGVSASAVIALAAASTTHAFATQGAIMVFALVVIAALAVAPRAFRGDDEAWLVLTSSAVALAFGLLYYRHTWASYLEFGAARALHGRYFYAVLPFLAFLLLRGFTDRWWPRVAAATAAAALLVSELFFLRHVFPMYGQV